MGKIKTLIFSSLLALFTVSLSARAETEKKSKEEVKEGENAENISMTAAQHSLFLNGLFSLTSGDVSAYDPGFGASLGYEYNLTPMVKTVSWLDFLYSERTQTRTGIDLSYIRHSGSFSTASRSYTTDLSLVVATTGSGYFYQINKQFEAGLKLYGGFSYTSGNTVSEDGSISRSASSVDGVLAPEVNLRYHINPDISMQLAGRYMLVFETVTGSFLQTDLGVIYHFKPTVTADVPTTGTENSTENVKEDES